SLSVFPFGSPSERLTSPLWVSSAKTQNRGSGTPRRFRPPNLAAALGTALHCVPVMEATESHPWENLRVSLGASHISFVGLQCDAAGPRQRDADAVRTANSILPGLADHLWNSAEPA